tara:strand:+ start:96 stop:257 length:162 start_codon:yes stop_codon:yes gene_type:complete
MKEKTIKEKTINELFDILYDLEIYLEFDETEQGKKLGEFINKLQKELINKTIK